MWSWDQNYDDPVLDLCIIAMLSRLQHLASASPLCFGHSLSQWLHPSWTLLWTAFQTLSSPLVKQAYAILNGHLTLPTPTPLPYHTVHGGYYEWVQPFWFRLVPVTAERLTLCWDLDEALDKYGSHPSWRALLANVSPGLSLPLAKQAYATFGAPPTLSNTYAFASPPCAWRCASRFAWRFAWAGTTILSRMSSGHSLSQWSSRHRNAIVSWLPEFILATGQAGLRPWLDIVGAGGITSVILMDLPLLWWSHRPCQRHHSLFGYAMEARGHTWTRSLSIAFQGLYWPSAKQGWTPGWTPDRRDHSSVSEELAATIVNVICLIKDTNGFPGTMEAVVIITVSVAWFTDELVVFFLATHHHLLPMQLHIHAIFTVIDPLNEAEDEPIDGGFFISRWEVQAVRDSPAWRFASQIADERMLGEIVDFRHYCNNRDYRCCDFSPRSMNHNNPIPAGPRAGNGALPFPLYVCAFLTFRFIKCVLTVTFADSPRSPFCLVNGRTRRLFSGNPSSSCNHANPYLRNLLCHRRPQSGRRWTYRRCRFYLALGGNGSDELPSVALRVANCDRWNDCGNCAFLALLQPTRFSMDVSYYGSLIF